MCLTSLFLSFYGFSFDFCLSLRCTEEVCRELLTTHVIKHIIARIDILFLDDIFLLHTIKPLITGVIEGRIIIYPSSSGCTEEFLIVLGHFIPKLKSLLIFQILSRKFLLPGLQSKIALPEGYDFLARICILNNKIAGITTELPTF